jgi:serralysin
MAYRLGAGSSRDFGLSAIHDSGLSFRADAMGSTIWAPKSAQALSAWDADLAVAPGSQTAMQKAFTTPGAGVDSSMLAQLESLLANAPDGFTMRCACDGCMKAAIQALGGHNGPQSVDPGDKGTNTPPIGGDDIPDDTSSTVTMDANGGDSLHSSINHLADHDFIQVNLTAGEIYQFTLTPDDPDGTTGPDLQMDIRDADGNLIEFYGHLDGGSFGDTESHNVQVSESGVYYIDVGAYNDASMGAYTLDIGIDPDPPQNFGTPLGAIDWGGTERRVDTDGVTDGEGNEVIQVYFSQAGETYESSLLPLVVAEGWEQWEKDAAFTAFNQYEHIINVRYEEVATAAESDFQLVNFATAPALLGLMHPPEEDYEGSGFFNNQGVGWTEEGLQQGGFGFITLIHEFGHGHALAHPHDNGGGSEVMHGVTGDLATGYTTGDFGLNQGIWTTMSYNDGWDEESPNGPAPEDSYGYQGTLMAFDVAVLQQKYGANMGYHTGDNNYRLPKMNEAGTFYSCVWDAGGEDTFTARGQLDAVVDLRPATLEYEVGGGGFLSWSEGIFGGLTIANGVVIENGVGANGNDDITGNDAANHLMGGRGKDSLDGGAGTDTIEGGKGKDELYGGANNDTFVFGDGSTQRHRTDSIGDLSEGDIIDVSGIDADIDAGGDQGFTLVGAFSETAGELVVTFDSGANLSFFMMDINGDGRADMVISADGDHSSYDNFVL